MTNREQRALTWGLVGVHLALGPLINYFGSAASHWEAPLDIGLLSGQVSVLAIWLAYSRGPLFQRLTASLLGLAYVWFWMLNYTSSLLACALIVGVQGTVVLGILVGWRRIRRRGRAAGRLPAGDSQFRLRELLLWTAAVAVVITAAKLRPQTSADLERELRNFDLDAAAANVTAALAFALSGLAGLWLALPARRGLAKLLAVCLLAPALLLICLPLASPPEIARWTVSTVASGLVVALTIAGVRSVHGDAPFRRPDDLRAVAGAAA
jgi:hypothetical protein